MIECSADALPQPRLRTQWENMQATAKQRHCDREEKRLTAARQLFCITHIRQHKTVE